MIKVVRPDGSEYTWCQYCVEADEITYPYPLFPQRPQFDQRFTNRSLLRMMRRQGITKAVPAIRGTPAVLFSYPFP